jgi:hypothetical protein
MKILKVLPPSLLSLPSASHGPSQSSGISTEKKGC